MSYEYSVTSNIAPNELYEKIKVLMKESSAYRLIDSSKNVSSFRNSVSDSAWESDIDLSFSSDSVFLDIHLGSARKLLEYLNDSLAKIDIHANFHEL